MDTLTGTLADIRFSKNGFLIGNLESGETVLGNMSEPVLGQEYSLSGDWVDDPRWGRQFKFQRYAAETPKDAEGIYLYLVRVCRWVGPHVGRQIVKQFGNTALDVLKTHPELVARDIKGITLERAQEISQNLLDNETQEAASVELESMLGHLHLPRTTITTLVEKYRSDAPARVRQDPYATLMEVRGIGFPTADRVAITLGYAPDGLARRQAAALHALQIAADTWGHTWVPGDKFVETVIDLIGIPPGDDVRVKLIEGDAIRVRDNMVALTKLADDELDVAGAIHKLMEPSPFASLASQGQDGQIDLEGLAPDQIEAFQLAMMNPIFILTGAPGTGKTYTLKRIIRQYSKWNYLIRLAAPTGKAAKRMTELIDMDGMDAMTIHRLLGPRPITTNGELRFFFEHGAGFPIPADFIVIDEFSMVDISLAASLFRATKIGIRVLIVGDHYQLPSVGPGAVLRDLLAAGVPSYELTEIKRNTGDIVQACHAIKDGRLIAPSSQLDPETGLNFRHIEESDPFKIQATIRDLVTQRLSMRGYNPVWDVQVLSPMNERTALSCLDLNTLLQNALNINPPVPHTPFRIGDKVIQRKNETIGSEFVVNGDLGEIQEIDSSEIKVKFLYPDRTVRIKRGAHHLQLAYCITIHKMQGSEAPVIILPLHSCFGGFLNREIIYTAISRAQDIFISVGQWSALETAVGRVGNVKRITRLVELIKGE